MIRLTFSALVVAGLLAACSPRETDAPIKKPGASSREVQHIVLCWLKTPGDRMARAQLIGTSLAFQDLPGVISVQAGEPLPSNRPQVDASFDVAIVMTFRDEAALRAYENHPAHRKAVEEVLKPLTARVIVYDFIPHRQGPTSP